MAYGDFAYYYDALNSEADYDKLLGEILRRLGAAEITEGLVADLGCGTGELTLRLAAAGYDMIALDASAEMLAVLREKMEEEEQTGILLLNQALQELDLYGTIRAAVCTFDTLSHIPPDELPEVFRRVSLFLEPGGLFLFDANTPYKHKQILADKTFTIEGEEGLFCHWQNHPRQDGAATEILLQISQNGRLLAEECFTEYGNETEVWEGLLRENGMKTLEILDGESFAPLFPESQRVFVVAAKQCGAE